MNRIAAFREATSVRDLLRPLYDISSRCTVRVTTDPANGTRLVTFQSFNPLKTLAMEAEMDESHMTRRASTDMVMESSSIPQCFSFNLTKMYKKLKLNAIPGDELVWEYGTEGNRNSIEWYLLRPPVTLQDMMQEGKRVRKIGKYKKTKTLKNKKLQAGAGVATLSSSSSSSSSTTTITAHDKIETHNSIENKSPSLSSLPISGPTVKQVKTADGQIRMLISLGKYRVGQRVRYITFPSIKDRQLQQIQAKKTEQEDQVFSNVLVLPTAELQSMCSELCILGTHLTVSETSTTLPNFRLSTVGLTGQLTFECGSTNNSVFNDIPATDRLHETYSLQLLLFCMQILSQCKVCRVSFGTEQAMLLEATTHDTVVFRFHIMYSMDKKKMQLAFPNFALPIQKPPITCEEEDEPIEQVIFNPVLYRQQALDDYHLYIKQKQQQQEVCSQSHNLPIHNNKIQYNDALDRCEQATIKVLEPQEVNAVSLFRKEKKKRLQPSSSPKAKKPKKVKNVKNPKRKRTKQEH